MFTVIQYVNLAGHHNSFNMFKTVN